MIDLLKCLSCICYMNFLSGPPPHPANRVGLLGGAEVPLFQVPAEARAYDQERRLFYARPHLSLYQQPDSRPQQQSSGPLPPCNRGKKRRRR